MSLMGDFEAVDVRIMPVLLLLDTSGSMGQDDKIVVLNAAVKEMIKELADVDSGDNGIRISVITFGGASASILCRNQKPSELSLNDLEARGKTPLGDALNLARELIDNRNEVPSNAFHPTVALLSDGHPVPPLESELTDFLGSERVQKASRMALAIGSDADREMLRAFSDDGRVREADEAAQIRNFLKWVTMTVLERTLTQLDLPQSELAFNPVRGRVIRSDDF